MVIKHGLTKVPLACSSLEMKCCKDREEKLKAAGACYIETQNYCDWLQWPGDLIARVENGIGLCLERTRFSGGNETICLMGHYMF